GGVAFGINRTFTMDLNLVAFYAFYRIVEFYFLVSFTKKLIGYRICLNPSVSLLQYNVFKKAIGFGIIIFSKFVQYLLNFVKVIFVLGTFEHHITVLHFKNKRFRGKVFNFFMIFFIFRVFTVNGKSWRFYLDAIEFHTKTVVLNKLSFSLSFKSHIYDTAVD